MTLAGDEEENRGQQPCHSFFCPVHGGGGGERRMAVAIPYPSANEVGWERNREYGNSHAVCPPVGEGRKGRGRERPAGKGA